MSREEGLNIMECVAFVCGQEHSSYPTTACAVISEVARTIADGASDEDRQSLVEYILPISLSAASERVMFKRLFYCVDFVVCQLAPAALTYLGLPREANALHSLDEITDIASAEKAREGLRKLFVSAFVHPSTAHQISLTLSQLETAAHRAAQVWSSECDALMVLQALKGVMTRFEKQADARLANMLFKQKRTLLKNLLDIGPSKQRDGDLIRVYRRNLSILQSNMARGTFGRRPGSETEI
jgi:hypothetical protein